MLTGLVQGMLAQGTVTDALIGGGSTAGIMAIAIGWLVKDRNKREDQHREDFKSLHEQHRSDMKEVADEVRDMNGKLIVVIENNTAAFTQAANETRELRHAIRNNGQATYPNDPNRKT
jgi:hypothetical protein